MEYVIRRAGRELGPYSEAEVRDRLTAGTLTLADLGRTDETAEWAPLSTFAPFAPGNHQPPPVPPRVAQPAEGRTPQGAGAAIETRPLGSYTAATLQPNERALHHTSIHWMALMPSIIGAGLALVVIVPIVLFAAWKDFYWAWLLVLIPFGIFGSAVVTVRTSELVITDRRVLIKVGFMRRHTFEMFISKIESVAVFQSMLGRLFNYGTVEIRGTGGSAESFATIAAPLPFRDAIQLVQSHSEQR